MVANIAFAHTLKKEFFRKGRGEVTKRSKDGSLFGNLIEFKKITFSDKQTELRCVFLFR